MKRRLIASLLGLITTLVLLEVTLAVSYRVFASTQSSRNLASIDKQAGEIRILTMGESTTAVAGNEHHTMLVPGTSYPSQLERILNERQSRYTFRVLNNGMLGGRTLASMHLLDLTIDDYQPHMIIAMMGIKDQVIDTPQEQGIGSWMSSFRTVQLGRWLLDTAIMREQQVDPDVELGQPLPELARHMKRPLKTYVRELRMPGADAWVLEQLEAALYLWYIGRLERAEALARDTVERTDLGHNVLARVLASGGRYPEALRVLEDAVARHPDEGMYLVGLLELQLEIRDVEAAAATAEIAMQGIPTFRERKFVSNYVHIAAARVRLAEGQPEQALALVRDIQSQPLGPHRDVFPSVDMISGGILGQAYIALEDWESAEAVLLPVIKRHPLRHSNTWLLSGVYRRTGRFEDEARMRHKLLEKTGRMADYFEIAKLFRLTGSGDQVPGLMADAIERIPDIHEGYRRLYQIVETRGIQLVVMQYPGFDLSLVDSYAPKQDGVVFIDNEHVFDADPDTYYFEPRYPSSFNHYTTQGANVLAQNVADTVLDVFPADRGGP